MVSHDADLHTVHRWLALGGHITKVVEVIPEPFAIVLMHRPVAEKYTCRILSNNPRTSRTTNLHPEVDNQQHSLTQTALLEGWDKG